MWFLLANLVWQLLGFIYITRWLKTRAKALVLCVIDILLKSHLDLFRDELIKESRQFLRREVF